MKKRCVFFDRDGIVNVSPGAGYVTRPEDLVIQPDFPGVLRAVLDSGYEAAVASNQRGVALGLMTEEDVLRIHASLERQLAESHGLRLLEIAYCPHDKDACDCRKPKPGMLLRVAARHGVDLSASWMVGDQERDVEAGRRAGCRTVLVGEYDAATKADYRVRNLGELNQLLLRLLQPGV